MFKEKIKEIKKKVISFYTFKGVKVRDKGTLYAKYLNKRKYSLMGLKSIDDKGEYATVIDKNKNEFFIVKLTLKKQNGLNKQIDNRNYNMVIDMLDKVENLAKIVSISEKVNELKSNIEVADGLYLAEKDEEIRADILDRKLYLEELNEHGEERNYMFIQLVDMERVLEAMNDVYYYKVLNHEEVKELLFQLNNR